MASFLGINNEELEKAMEEAIDCTGMANDEGSEVITGSKHPGQKGNMIRQCKNPLNFLF